MLVSALKLCSPRFQATKRLHATLLSRQSLIASVDRRLAIRAIMTISTDIISESKYPAKKHAERVTDYISSKGGEVSDGVLYLESAKTRMNEDNDQEAPFRQRRYFYYLTGCDLPDSYYMYDLNKKQSTLFIPPVVPEEVVWSGPPLSPEEAKEKFEIDDVQTSDQVNHYLSRSETPKKQIWAIDNQIADDVTFLAFESKDLTLLKEAIEECRVVKDDYEIALMRKANEISEIAHKAVMGAVSKASNERELEALFQQQCMANGCRKQAYSTIIASGTDASTLHYVHNDKAMSSKTRNLLIDAGGEYNCYAADITRTYPVNGEFTRGSESIYNIVLKMQKECIDMLKAGVLWDEVHEHAHRVAIEGLLKIGILKGDAKEIFDARTSTVFFPHGLGHYLGMDTHDTGGHPNYQDPDPMFRYLRVRGKLPKGSVITVEPGIYFCKYMIDPALQNETHSKYINKDTLEGYWEVGGVRIEDNVLITDDGYENLTSVPKEIEDMTKLINASTEVAA